jgi:hypothetical protein
MSEGESTMTTDVDYGRMTPGMVRKVAQGLPDSVRYLNHATIAPVTAALAEPADVDVVLAALVTVQERLPQLLDQLGRWLAAECAAGRVRVTSGVWAASPSTEALAVSALRHYLTEAAARAVALGEVLHEARQCTATLAGVPGEEESP